MELMLVGIDAIGSIAWCPVPYSATEFGVAPGAKGGGSVLQPAGQLDPGVAADAVEVGTHPYV
jgi:hypothetical protein